MRNDFTYSRRLILTALFLGVFLFSGTCLAVAGQESLPSWNIGAAKQSIINFVKAVTKGAGKDYVKPAERIAVFDNDGTLWSEKPFYFQLFFTIDRLKELASKRPEWRYTQPFQAALEGDIKTLIGFGEHGLMELVMATHAGTTTDEFSEIVKKWLATATHPTLKKPFTELVYQPMLELLRYLRTNGFKTFIVSGGGIEFMRPWTEAVYGVPPEQVVGSSIKTKFEMRGSVPTLVRLPEINFINDKGGKPVGINQHIGRRPIAAFGNSDGDLQMLQWTTAGPGKRLGMIVHHTDAEREFAYDRDSSVGRLDKALIEAPQKGWVVVDMKKDWKVIYP